MNKPHIVTKQKDLTIPWFEQIEKTVLMPDSPDEQVYYSIKPPDYVTALVSTTGNKFIIVKQFRPAVEDYVFELPSGHVDEGETPAQAMVREVKEETGCTAEAPVLLGELIPDTGRLENRLWAFSIRDIQLDRIPAPEENEGIEVHAVSREELFAMMRAGRLNHALDLSVIALALLNGHLPLYDKEP